MANPESAVLDADYQRVAIACRRLQAEGTYPGVRSVQRFLKEQLGGGIKTERIGPLIRRWELEARPAEAPANDQEPPVSLEDILAAQADLRPAVEALAGALVGILEARARHEAEERVRAVQSAIEVERERAAEQRHAAEIAHAAALAERETVIAGLRAQEAAQVEEIERLEGALADQAAAAEAARQDLALTKTDLRKTANQAEALAASLDQAEERGGVIPKLEADLAAARQSLAVAEETRTQMAALVDGLRADLQAERTKGDRLHERIERLAADLAAAVARGADGSRPSEASDIDGAAGSSPPGNGGGSRS